MQVTDYVQNEDLMSINGVATTLTRGGQSGHMIRIGTIASDGKRYAEWMSSHPYISKNVIPVVLKTPKFFEYMPNTDQWIAAYKSLIEVKAQEITGLQSGITLEFDETEIGHAGDTLETVSKGQRAKSNPSFTWKEVGPKSITKFWDTFIRYGMIDPDTGKVLIAENITDFDGIYTPDMWTGTVFFIEPDITQRKVVDAWACSNFAPKNGAERTGSMAMTGANEGKEISIEFTAITLNNDIVIAQAQTILDSLTTLHELPDASILTDASEMYADVKAQEVGYQRAHGKQS